MRVHPDFERSPHSSMEWIVKPRRHDADYGVLHAIEFYGFAQDLRVPREAALPEAVGNERDLGFAGRVPGQKPAADSGVHANDFEESGGDAGGRQYGGVSRAGEANGQLVESGHTLEGRGMAGQIDVVGIGQAGGRAERALIDRMGDQIQAVGLGKGKRANQYAVDYREDGGVGSDPEA